MKENYKDKIPYDGLHCALCGNPGKLIKTDCCNQWLCIKTDKQGVFIYDRRSCYTKHMKYTLCAAHYNNQHSGNWKECLGCRELYETEMYVWYGTNEYNLEKLPNPPKYEPSKCIRCRRVIVLSQEAYMDSVEGRYCDKCSIDKINEDNKSD